MRADFGLIVSNDRNDRLLIINLRLIEDLEENASLTFYMKINNFSIVFTQLVNG